MASEGVSLPLIHKHLMMLLNDYHRKGDCCGRSGFTSSSYYCESSDFFVHKQCVDEAYEYIEHPSHSVHTLKLQSKPQHRCDLCDKSIMDLCYRCEICDFDADLYCAKYPPPEVVDYEFSYRCHECNLTFHVDCVWNPPEAKHLLEINHSHHPLHPLKLHIGPPLEYSDGKCRLCAQKIYDKFFIIALPVNSAWICVVF
ncbi:hypothetical protein AtEden1_Chr1g0039061 [Arabidopsis thaliana]